MDKKERKEICPDYEPFDYEGKEICREYHIKNKSCYKHECTCIFRLKQMGYEDAWELCKTFNLIEVR